MCMKLSNSVEGSTRKMTTIRNRRWRYYNEIGYDNDEELANSLLNNTIIPDIKDAEKVGAGPPLSSFTAEQLHEKLLDLELILNKDNVDYLRSEGRRREAAMLDEEIRLVEALRALK